jgi:hypothetical protein
MFAVDLAGSRPVAGETSPTPQQCNAAAAVQRRRSSATPPQQCNDCSRTQSGREATPSARSHFKNTTARLVDQTGLLEIFSCSQKTLSAA